MREQLSVFSCSVNPSRKGRDPMKKLVCTILTVLLATALAGGALAEQRIRLPESSYTLAIPDGMEYDGPGESPDDARFAWVSEKLGLDIEFFCQSNEKGVPLKAMAEVLAGDGIETTLQRIAGIEMIAYHTSDPGDLPGKGMKCVGYVIQDGSNVQMICFWYANQEAADLTAEIISSIKDGD